MNSDEHIFEILYDTVIIGSGGAGCSAAIEAWEMTKKVVILTKGAKDLSKTANAQGGLQAAIGKHDSVDAHYQDTIAAGNKQSNPLLVEVLTQSASKTVEWLENIGVQFDRNNGSYNLKKAAGISNARVLSCGDETGNKLIRPILQKVADLGIPLIENCGVNTIAKIEDKFEIFLSGVASHSIKAKTVIIATGGLMPREKRLGMEKTLVNSMPDGIELASKLGAKCQHADLVQYHPTGIILPSKLKRERLPETMRGAGAKLLNKHLKEFVDPLKTRNQLSDAIVAECDIGNGVVTEDGRQGVWLTTPDIDKQSGAGYTQQNYPKFYKLFKDLGHDLSKDPVLVYPIVHYSLGGVQIDEKARTTVTNLFAAGETTWGVHGEERLMGNSLLDIFVFGRIAGRSAAEAALSFE